MSQLATCLLTVREELLSWILRCVSVCEHVAVFKNYYIQDCWRERGKRTSQVEVQRCIWQGHNMPPNAAISSKGMIVRHLLYNLSSLLFSPIITSPRR